MVRARLKNKTFRKVKARIISGLKVQYKRRKPSRAVCSECGDGLKGVPNEIPSKMRNLPKTKKRPERPYGGNLCSRCMREKIKESIRND